MDWCSVSVRHREMLPDDRRFITSAWSSSYKNSHTAGMIFTDDYADVMHRQIARILDWPSTRTVVAFESRDPNFVYGFICGDTSREAPIVFYVNVKEPYRRSGTARALFAALGVNPERRFYFACKTAIVATLARKIPSARFAPELARYPKERRATP